MFIDASVIVAILNEEPDAKLFVDRLAAAPGPLYVSPLVRFEAALALARAAAEAMKKAKPTREMMAQAHDTIAAFVAQTAATDIAISPQIGDLAIMAAAKYGKAVGHKADLNFGDCFAYASAKALGVPLLYKGNDFAETDLA